MQADGVLDWNEREHCKKKKRERGVQLFNTLAVKTESLLPTQQSPRRSGRWTDFNSPIVNMKGKIMEQACSHGVRRVVVPLLESSPPVPKLGRKDGCCWGLEAHQPADQVASGHPFQAKAGGGEEGC